MKKPASPRTLRSTRSCPTGSSSSPRPFGADAKGTNGGGRTPVPGTCPAKGAPPLLEPEALQTMHVNSLDPTAKTARSLGYDGKGVKVGFISDGLDINNTEFIRADGTHVFVDYKDFSGEGTDVPTGGGEAFLDAGSVAAQGRNVYDLSNYERSPLCADRAASASKGSRRARASSASRSWCGRRRLQLFVPPGHRLRGRGRARQRAERVARPELLPRRPASLDLIKQANDQAVAAGTSVTVSSGDAGVTNTTGSPSTDPNVIAVGTSTTYRLPLRLGYGGSQFGVTGWLNNNISSLSSSGFEQDGTTISLGRAG